MIILTVEYAHNGRQNKMENGIVLEMKDNDKPDAYVIAKKLSENYLSSTQVDR